MMSTRLYLHGNHSARANTHIHTHTHIRQPPVAPQRRDPKTKAPTIMSTRLCLQESNSARTCIHTHTSANPLARLNVEIPQKTSTQFAAVHASMLLCDCCVRMSRCSLGTCRFLVSACFCLIECVRMSLCSLGTCRFPCQHRSLRVLSAHVPLLSGNLPLCLVSMLLVD